MTCTPSASCWRRANSCGRPECRTRSNLYAKRNRALKGLGRPRRVPAEPTAARLRDLRRTYSTGYLEEALSMSSSQISRITSGKQRTVSIATAQRVAQPLTTPTIRRMTDATGTRRRLQALALRGWSSQHIADHANVPQEWVGYVLSRSITNVDHLRAARITDTYKQLWLTDGPSTITKDRAQRAGYVPAAAWDNIDDPDEQPQLGAPPTGDPRRVVHLEDIEWMIRAGATWPEILTRVPAARDHIRATLKNAGRTDLIHQLERDNAA